MVEDARHKESDEDVETRNHTTADILKGLLARAQLLWLLRHYARRPVLALFSVLMGTLSLALISIVALVTRSPFVFPSLGPTAFYFFYRPMTPAASPRNALVGGAIGIGAGALALVLTGLASAPGAPTLGITWPRVAAVAVSFALTTALLVLLRVEHPPALSATLMIALGVFTEPLQLLALFGGMVLLTLQAILVNRAAGLPYPLWAPLAAPNTQPPQRQPS